MENFVNEIEDRITTNFKITKIPVGYLKQFKLFCKEECGDMYAVGLVQLLKTKQQYENLIPLLTHIIDRLDKLETKQLNTKEVKIKTFEDENQ